VLRPKKTISAVSKGQVDDAPLKLLALGQFGSLLALGSKNKYSNKIIAKMLHLSTET